MSDGAASCAQPKNQYARAAEDFATADHTVMLSKPRSKNTIFDPFLGHANERISELVCLESLAAIRLRPFTRGANCDCPKRVPCAERTGRYENSNDPYLLRRPLVPFRGAEYACGAVEEKLGQSSPR